MKYIFIVVGLSCPGAILHGQSLERTVLGSAGTDIRSGDVQLSWTLGETAVLDRNSTQGRLTEGFHQARLQVISQAAVLPDFIEPSFSPAFVWQVFPVPAQSTVAVSTTGLTEPALLQVFDSQGRLLWSGLLPANDGGQVIDLSGEPAGHYWLVARNQQKEVMGSAQIIKQ
jgi:hypothetical protein